MMDWKGGTLNLGLETAMNSLGKNATAGGRSLRVLRARGPTPPRFRSVIRKGIIVQGHGVKRFSPMFL